MNELKENFKTWLKEKGFKAKGKGIRYSTVDGYINKINAIAQLFFKDNDYDGWRNLADSIDQILPLYHEYSRAYCIIPQNSNVIVQHLKEIANLNVPVIGYPRVSLYCIADKQFLICNTNDLKSLPNLINVILIIVNEALPYSDNKMTLETLGALLKLRGCSIDDKGEFYNLYNKLYDKLHTKTPNDYVFLCIKYQVKGNSRNRIALTHYYDFLKQHYLLSEEGKLKAKKLDFTLNSHQKFYQEKAIVALKTSIDITGNNSHEVCAGLGMNDVILHKEIKDFLNCNKNTVTKLPIKKSKRNSKGFNAVDVNQHFKNHFHKTTESYPVNYTNAGDSNWCDAKTAAKILNVSRKTIYIYTRDGKLTYTDYLPRKQKYYRPELKYLAQKQGV